MVNTVKFSQFSSTNPSSANTVVGLSGGLNSKITWPISWTTALRPIAPNNGWIGYNTDLELYEFWNGVIWQQLGTGDAGTVTAVATGTGLTGGTITTSGTISFAAIAANSFWANTTGGVAVPTVVSLANFLLASNNLSDLTNKPLARTNLGVAIGSNVEAWSATLDQIAAGVWAGATSITTLGTISTGVWNGSPIGVAFGGTGNNTFTAYSVICAGTTSTGAFQNVSGVGSAGQILTSNGAGLLPTWQSATGTGTVNAGLINQLAYYAANGNTVSGLATLASGVLVTSAGGVPSIGQTLPSAVQTNITQLGTITAGVWQGTPVGVAFGGTGNSSFTAYAVLCAGTTSTGAFQNVSGVGTAGQILTSNGAALLPSWQSPTGTGTVTAGLINQLAYYAANGSTVSGLATANNGTLVTSAGGVPSISQTLPSAVQTNITQLGTITTGVWNGTTILVGNGGTGATSFTAYAVVCGGITSTGALQNVSGVGSVGQVLTSNGAAALPSWQAVSGGGTVSPGLINQLAYYSSAGNTVSGLTTASGGVLVTNNAGAPSILPGSATTGTVLQAVSGGAPAWSTISYPSTAGTTGQHLASNGSNVVYSTSTYADTYAVSTLLYASSANVVTGLATANSAWLKTNGSGVPAWSTTLPFTVLSTQTFVASGTYTPTAGMKWCIVEAVAQGAGGGGAANAASGGSVAGGGGAGSYSRLIASAATIGVSQTVTIANTGGGGGAAGNNIGTAGSDASLGTICIAKGGSPGNGAGSNIATNGGAGGVAGTGTLTLVGNGGNAGTGGSINTTTYMWGRGGVSFFGGVSAGKIVNAANAGNGSNGGNYGNGGDGGTSFNGSGTAAGGNGGGGIIIITEFG